MKENVDKFQFKLDENYLSAIKWLPNMGGTAEFGWGPDGPCGTGKA